MQQRAVLHRAGRIAFTSSQSRTERELVTGAKGRISEVLAVVKGKKKEMLSVTFVIRSPHEPSVQSIVLIIIIMRFVSWRFGFNDIMHTLCCKESLRLSVFAVITRSGLAPYRAHAHKRYSSIESCPRVRYYGPNPEA